MGYRLKIAGIIPARYASTRLPGKPLKDICGKTMIQRVYERVCKSKLVDEVIVATDDFRIITEVERFGGKAVMTSADHLTGTDRIAEVAQQLDCDIVVNIQGDEPLIMPEIIDEVISALVTDKNQVMTTCCTAIHNKERLNNHHVVKVVSDIYGNAMMFSRSVLPYPFAADDVTTYEHIGIFAFRKDFLLKYITLPQTPLSLTESLEQLKAMESGYPIKVVKTKFPYYPPSIDTQENLDNIIEFIKTHAFS